MKTRHSILLFLLIVFVGLISIFLYRTYHYFEKPQNQALNLIPDNAAFIIKGMRSDNFLEFYKENTCFLSSLYSEKQMKRMDYVFNTVLSLQNCKQVVKHSSLYLSNVNEELVVVIETSRRYNRLLADFMNFLKTDFANKSFVYKNNTIYSLFFDNDYLYLNYQNGLLLMTFNENLMRKAINKLELKSDGIQSAINLIPAQRNENAQMYFYVQYQYFIPYLKNKLRKIGGDIATIDMLKPCQWSVFDLSVKNQNILLSGYTRIDTSIIQSKLLTHKNNKIDFMKMLPYNANRVFSIKANCADDWTKIPSMVWQGEDFLSLMYPTRITTFEMENDGATYNYLLINSENVSEASFHLYNSLNSYFDCNKFFLDTMHVGSMFIGRIEMPNFVFSKLGINGQLSRLKYYTVIDNYIIFTDKKESILTYITCFRQHKSLKMSDRYKSLQDYFSDEANLFYYYDFTGKEQKNYDNFTSMRVQIYAQSDSIVSTNVVIMVNDMQPQKIYPPIYNKQI